MLKFDKISKQKKNFSRLTGVTIKEFQEIVQKARPYWDKLMSKKKVSGRTSKLKTLEDELLLLLIYYRFYVSFKFLEILFDMDASNICRHINRLEKILAKAITIKKDRTLTEQDLTILIDATEIAIQRPKRGQRKFYSGKKRKHVLKEEIQTDQYGKILNISKSYEGRMHDFKIRKKSDHIPKNAEVQADSGYQGLQKIHKNTKIPYKRRRNKPLTPEQKAHNSKLASSRITVEHVFAQLKKFKILGTVYRNFRKKLNLRFNIIAGIYNLRFG